MGGQRPQLNLRVAQKQILTPGLVQMVSVLALNKLELRQMINQEMVENPILEELADEVQTPENPSDEAFVQNETEKAAEEQAETDPFDEMDIKAFFDDYLETTERPSEREEIEKPSFETFLSSPTSLADHLEWQLSLTPCEDRVRDAASSIIGNLDEDGYLNATFEEIANSGSHDIADVEKALKLMQEFDPPGVAARDLRECLLVQLKTIAPDSALAQQIVSDHLKQVQNKQYKEIARALNRSVPAVMTAIEIIRRLDPRPGQRYNKTNPRLIEPDVFFVKSGDEYQILMNEDDLPQLRLSPVYRRLLDRAVATREVRNYVKERFTSAVQLLKNIEQRKHTIIRVCEAIIRRQRDFLDRGMDELKPMMIKEVAEEVGVHPSTVSRAVANKYAHTPQGVFELRYFFSEAVSGPQGGHTSLLTLKRRVKKMIEEEDSGHPLTDEQIAKRLAEEGILVTRRTVAKYREDMKIPSTHQRRIKA
jgi:RNA polymerase sigma-54 factor